jgi:hypothetical protein
LEKVNKVYIHNACSISTQGLRTGLDSLSEVAIPDEINAQQPNFKEELPGVPVRRLSKISKMAMTCAMKLSNDIEWDAIVFATGLGNLADTEKFIKTYSLSKGLIPPTSFTQSGHNTITGFIALQLKSNAYNMTHVQREHSFEYALQDAVLQLLDKQNVLVGAADEHIDFLDQWLSEMKYPQVLIEELSEGAAFFHLSNQPSNVVLTDISFYSFATDVEKVFLNYCESQSIDQEKCSTILSAPTLSPDWSVDFVTEKHFGRFFTNSSLAFHVAVSKSLHLPKGYSVVLVNVSMHQGVSFIHISHE